MKIIFCFLILCCSVVQAKEYKSLPKPEIKIPQEKSDLEKNGSQARPEAFYVCIVPTGSKYKVSDLDGLRKCSELNGDPFEGKAVDANLPLISTSL
ncbi:MAG: hypothetical protein ACXVCY_11345 [Pseudobdellovibrionaceae bacterium]